MLFNENHAAFALPYDPKPITAADTVLLFHGAEVLLRQEPQDNRLPLWGEVSDAFTGIVPLHVFTQEDRRFFIADLTEDITAPSGFAMETARAFRMMQPVIDAALLNVACHLSAWYNSHRFCGVCGGQMHPAPAERALLCGDCGITIYPSILPAVIVAVTDGNRLLLARNAHGSFRRFLLLAGFVEVGETAEQTVAREVLEEVGLRVKNIRYAASQPWGISQSLMLAFTAELDGSPAITLQEAELAEARWFTRDEVPENDSNVGISFDLMERFRKGKLNG